MQVNVRGSSLYYRKSSEYNFIPDYIYCTHFVITIFNSLIEIRFKLWIVPCSKLELQYPWLKLRLYPQQTKDNITIDSN